MAEPYEDVASWGQAVKGDEQFADRAFEEDRRAEGPAEGADVEAVARG